MPGRNEQADFPRVAFTRPMAARAVPAYQAGGAGLLGGGGAVRYQGFLDSWNLSGFPTGSRPHWIAPASLPFLEAVAIYGLGVMTDGGPKQLRALAKSYERAPSLRLIALLSPSSTGASETASPV